MSIPIKYHNWVYDESIGWFICAPFVKEGSNRRDCQGCGEKITEKLLEIFINPVNGRDRILDLIAGYYLGVDENKLSSFELMEDGELV